MEFCIPFVLCALRSLAASEIIRDRTVNKKQQVQIIPNHPIRGFITRLPCTNQNPCLPC